MTAMDLDEVADAWLRSRLAELLNSVGERCEYTCSRDCFSTLAWNRFRAEGIRLLLALRAFEADHGCLPQTLAQLVPDSIEGIPLDPFDGQELRYCLEAGSFHSVGEDLVDSGGGPGPAYTPEPTFAIGPRHP